MAFIKKNELLPQRPIIMVLYGTPGTGKTSMACTAENPLLIDTDRGFDRACQRVDTITANKWEDIYNAENLGNTETKGIISDYSTIIIDTAKACLDDYLSAYVVQLNYKLATNSLKRFGEMADQFRAFVNILRAAGKDIIFICHDKETQDGDVIRHAPDCTGQSKDLLVRIADMVGYICKNNGKRVLSFEPTDTRVGKNTAQLPTIEIPQYGSEDFKLFCKNIIEDVKKAIQSNGEAQQQALKAIEEANAELTQCETVEAANKLAEKAKKLAPVARKAFCLKMVKELKAKGITVNPETKKFEKLEKTTEKEEVSK